ncbi:MAG: 3-oxoacyl-[acyl-carrier-protein] reductase [Eubacteriales bacterium]|nr:3-oxoacyl-[acyl-carrier-protein] reductase [Eubacteriales bacterium]MDD4389349.1 3-oxoacyl-[acyl-carrier-protein] reductase [Eubacteriales bacterium]
MLKGKTALITGGSRGIGKAIALAMGAQGANVALFYAGNEKAARETCESVKKLGVEAECWQCDVSDFEASGKSVKEVLSRFGNIDILVNNAGITRDNLILTMKKEEFDEVVDTNLKGSFYMIKHMCGPFMKQKRGTIINIASVSGMMGNAGQANYSSAKAGVIGLTKSVARELAPRGITCNAIAPGFIVTDMTDKMQDAAKESVVAMIPLKKMGRPEDIANTAVFLASENAAYITGEIIKVDGGIYI